MGDVLTKDDRVRFRRNHAYVVDTCFNTTMMVGRAAGASSLFESSPIQRFVRDVHAGSMQVAVNWDEQAEAYGPGAELGAVVKLERRSKETRACPTAGIIKLCDRLTARD